MLQNKVALVTGSSKGIGEAIVQRLAEYHASVAIAYHTNQRQGEALLEQLLLKGADVQLVQLNVKDEESLARAFRQIEERYGKLDILVNNAGLGIPKPLEELSLEEWSNTMEVNLTGAFLTIKHAVPLLKQSNDGRIINISSVAALTGGSFGPHYGASKAGLIGLTKNAARELAKYNISVNAIAPGPIASEMTDSLRPEAMKAILDSTPLHRLGEMREVAELVCQLANPRIGYITGQSIVMDGGRYMH